MCVVGSWNLGEGLAKTTVSPRIVPKDMAVLLVSPPGTRSSKLKEDTFFTCSYKMKNRRAKDHPQRSSLPRPQENSFLDSETFIKTIAFHFHIIHAIPDFPFHTQFYLYNYKTYNWNICPCDFMDTFCKLGKVTYYIMKEWKVTQYPGKKIRLKACLLRKTTNNYMLFVNIYVILTSQC